MYKRIFALALPLTLALVIPSFLAAQSLEPGEQKRSASAELNFRVIIPPTLYFVLDDHRGASRQFIGIPSAVSLQVVGNVSALSVTAEAAKSIAHQEILRSDAGAAISDMESQRKSEEPDIKIPDWTVAVIGGRMSGGRRVVPSFQHTHPLVAHGQGNGSHGRQMIYTVATP